LWGTWSGDDPQEDFSQIGLEVPERRVENFRNQAIFCQRAGTYCLNVAISENFPSKSGNFEPFFPEKVLCVINESHGVFFLSQGCEILPPQKKLLWVLILNLLTSVYNCGNSDSFPRWLSYVHWERACMRWILKDIQWQTRSKPRTLLPTKPSFGFRNRGFTSRAKLRRTLHQLIGTSHCNFPDVTKLSLYWVWRRFLVLGFRI